MVIGRWLIAAGLVVALAGCGGGDEPSDGAATASPSETAAPPASASPTGAPALTDEVLLTSEDMPEWNAMTLWVPADIAWSEVLRLCDVPTPEQLGAASVVSAQYRMTASDSEGTVNESNPGNVGGNAVLRFAGEDAAAAAQTQVAEAVESCVPGGANSTTPFVLTRADGVESWAWAAQPADMAGGDMLLFEFLGVGRSGDELTLVAMAIEGMDANYAGDPLWTSIQLSLTRLG